MNEEESIDAALRRRLRASLQPGPTEAGAELARLRPRFERAKRRRAVTYAAGSTAAAVVVLAGSLAWLNTPRDSQVETEKVATSPRDGTPTSVDDLSTLAPSTTDGSQNGASTTLTSTAPPETTLPDQQPTPDPQSTPDPQPGGSTATPQSQPGPARPSGSVPTTTAILTGPTESPTSAPSIGGERIMSCEGGTAKLAWSASSLNVVRTDPASGWTLQSLEQKDALRVVVTFRRDGGGSGQGSGTASIDARVINGELIQK